MKSERHEALLAIVNGTGRVEVAELARRLGVSEITARRDLLELEAGGFLKRVHGGAVPVGGRSSERPFHVRDLQQAGAKEAIARAAASMVESGDAIALDVGSTVLHMIEHLGHAANLTLVTANLRTAWAVANSRSLMRPFRLIVSGGVVREDEMSMTGESALAHYRKMRVDIAFLGVAGVDAAAGLTDFNLEDAELKRHLVESARKTVVLADHTKLGAVNFAQIADVRQLDLLITDVGADPEQVRALQEAGLAVQLVGP